jgi:hypothetical protein
MRKPPSAKQKRRYDLNAKIEACRKAAKTRQRMKIARAANKPEARPANIEYNQ